ncbi:MAG: GHKL domain-containing protein [Negativibacillus sp.]
MSRSMVLLTVQLGCTAAVGAYLAQAMFKQRGWRCLAVALLLAVLGAAGALAGYGWLSLPGVCIAAFLLVHLGDRLGTNRVSLRFAALFVLVQVGLFLLEQNGTAAQGSWAFSVLEAAVFFLSENNQNFLRKSYEQSMMEYQNKVVAKQVEEVQGLYMTMRGWRHDYHNHLQALKAQLSMGQTELAQEYLGRLEQDLDSIRQLVETGNVSLDAILNSKLSYAQKQQISLHYKATVPPKLSVSDIDLCVLLGNLIDNAVEACEQLPVEQRFLRLYIGIFRKQLYISVTNATGELVRKLDEEYITTKRGTHGHGLKRINNTVEKYGGFINRKNEPGVFATEIMLPL